MLFIRHFILSSQKTSNKSSCAVFTDLGGVFLRRHSSLSRGDPI